MVLLCHYGSKCSVGFSKSDVLKLVAFCEVAQFPVGKGAFIGLWKMVAVEKQT